jgi:hypothetical protein
MANGIVTGGLYSVDGSFTLAGTAVGRGTFVVPDYATGTAAIPTSGGLKDVWFVMNGITTAPELAQDDKNFVIEAGEKLELAKFQLGAKFITDQFDGDFSTYSVDGVVMVSNTGKIVTDSSGVFKATIKEKLTSWCGANALRCIVTAV